MCITCDNASNNNAMVDELESKVTGYNGKASHARCFLHIINLVAKTLTREFDVKNKNTDRTKAAETCDEALKIELAELADGMDVEDGVTIALDRANRRVEDDEEFSEEDNEEGWVDEVELLTNEERSEFEGEILPVKLAIVKVC